MISSFTESDPASIARGRRQPSLSEYTARSSFLRAFNDGLVRAGAGAARDVTLIVCECESDDCNESLEVDTGEYRRVRQHAGRFLVAPGHQNGQRVLKKNRRIAVVELIPAP